MPIKKSYISIIEERCVLKAYTAARMRRRYNRLAQREMIVETTCCKLTLTSGEKKNESEIKKKLSNERDFALCLHIVFFPLVYTVSLFYT